MPLVWTTPAMPESMIWNGIRQTSKSICESLNAMNGKSYKKITLQFAMEKKQS